MNLWLDTALTFLAALFPVVLYFFYWFLISLKDETKVDYSHTMWLNFVSATSLNSFFIYVFLYANNYIQLFN